MPRRAPLRIRADELSPVRKNLPVIAAVGLATALALALCLAPAAHAGRQSRPPIQTEQSTTSQTIPGAEIQLVQLNTNDNGSHSIEQLATLQPGVVKSWKDFDPKGVVREDGDIQYSTTPSGTSVKTEETRNYFSDHGTLNARTISDWDLTGKQTSFRLTDYNFRGFRISDHITRYETEGHVESTWNPRTYDWSSTTIPYTPAAAPAATATQPGSSMGTQMNWNLRVDYKIGCLFPLDYHAGDQFAGSCWKADYAEAFKSVPGLYEYTFPIQTYPLQDGTPNWSGMEFGVKGYGYSPMGSDGRICLRIPKDWKGALQFQMRQPDYLVGNAPFTTNFQIGDPVPSPALPSNLFSTPSHSNIDYEAADYLIDLWNGAFDLEEEYDQIMANGEVYYGELWDVEDDLDDVYDEIDYATDYLPTSVIVSMAKQMAEHNRDLNAILRTQNLTPDQETKLQEYDRWATFLDGEADYFTEETSYFSHYAINPFWESPVQSQDKLIGLRGPFFGNPDNTGIYIDGTPIRPLAMTPKLCYFMPTPGLTAGEHTYTIDSPGMPETTLPFFYMWLTMWADDLNLHKGQHTTYHLKLDLNFTGQNSLWNSSSSSSFFPSDLVSPSELGNSPMPGTSRKGSITLSITNASSGVITMKNVFETFDASKFEPQGSIQVDGGVGAIQDGSFSIIGVAHAYLQPLLGLGLWPGTTPSSMSTPSSDSLFPNYGWSLTPTSTSAPNALNCPGLGTESTTPEATGASGGTSSYNFNLPINHCMGSAAFDDYTQAMGGSSTVEIGGPPTQEERDAARKRVEDARQKVRDAYDRYDEKRKIAAAFWEEAMKNVPSDVQMQASYAYADKYAADLAYKKALDEYKNDPSAANNAKLQTASVANANAIEAFDKAVKAEIDHFTPAARAEWEAAVKERKEAELDKDRANQELRDAHEAEDRLRPTPAWIKYSF